MIARADSFEQRIHTHGSTPGNQVTSWLIGPGNGYVIKQNDKLYVRQYNAGAYGGPNIKFTDNTDAYQHVNDTAGQPISAMSTQNQWVNRVVDLSSFAGKTAAGYQVITDASSPSGTYDIYYNDMAIVSADGTVTSIYDRQSGGPYSIVYNSGQSNLSAVNERSNGQGDSVQGYTTTVYYQGDHLGSTRMVTGGGGWPVVSTTFYPFGQEPVPAADPNHYRFASLESDGDSGLGPVTDHAGARQYSPATGSWMSPDPYDGSYNLANPQSLNRYAYVLNNPMGYNDTSGLDGCQATEGGYYCVGGVPNSNPSQVYVAGGTNSSDGNTIYVDPNTGETFIDFPPSNPQSGSNNADPVNTGACYPFCTGAPHDPSAGHANPGQNSSGGNNQAPGKPISPVPRLCGGTFTFAGKEGGAPGAGGFVGGITEHDSVEGTSYGTLVEGWIGGEGGQVGGGRITPFGGAKATIIGFFGAGLEGVLAGVQVGWVGGRNFSGLYVEAHFGPVAVGTGAYVTTTPCKKEG